MVLGLRIRTILFAAALALLATAPAADAFIYFGHSQPRLGVGRAGLDGSGAQNAFMQAPPGWYATTMGVAVDANNLYFVTNAKDSVVGGYAVGSVLSRANLDGTSPSFATAQITGQYGNALAVSGTHAYWTSNSLDTSDVGRTPKQGGQQFQAFTSVFGQTNPRTCGVAVDDTYVYFANIATYSIGRAKIADFGTATPPDGQWIQLDATGSDAERPCGVAVDDNYVYWGTFENGTSYPYTPGSGIGRAAKSNGGGAASDWGTSGERVTGLAVDDDYVYSSNMNDGNITSGTIGRANKSNGVGTSSLVSGLNNPWGVAVDAKGPEAPPPAVGGGGGIPMDKPAYSCSGCTSGGGGESSAVPPDFSQVWGAKKTFKVASWSTPLSGASTAANSGGTVFNYILNKPGTVKINIKQSVAGRKKGKKCSASAKTGKRCKLLVKKTTLTRTSRAGRNSVPFSGRINGKALKPGDYVAEFVGQAQSGNAVSKAKTFAFRILKP